jgi:predicted alpha/beta hydrolase family esterase
MMSFLTELFDEYRLIGTKIIWARKCTVTPQKWLKGNKGDIVLIPGINEKWTFLGVTGNKLNKLGWRIHYPVSHTRESIEKISQEVENYIRTNNLKNVFIIAHSKGGIVARRLLTKKIEKTIKKAILLATPHRGSILAFLPMKGIGELKPNCETLNQINDWRDWTKIVNIYPKWDNHVIPNSSLKLEGARNIKLDIGGHTRILDDPRTYELIEREIDSRMNI